MVVAFKRETVELIQRPCNGSTSPRLRGEVDRRAASSPRRRAGEGDPPTRVQGKSPHPASFGFAGSASAADLSPQAGRGRASRSLTALNRETGLRIAMIGNTL